MATVTSLDFYRGSAFEAPSTRGLNLGAILKGAVRIGGQLLGVPTLPGGAPAMQTAVPLLPPAAAAASAAAVTLAPRILQAARVAWSGFNMSQALQLATTAARQWLPAIIAFGYSADAASRIYDAIKHLAGELPGGKAGRRYRRMNPLNLRALTRADRRLTKFSSIARRYVGRCAPQRRVRAFKRRKRS